MKILYLSAEPIRSRQASATHVHEIVNELSAAGHEIVTCFTRAVGPYEQASLLRRSIAYLMFWVQSLKQLRQADLVYARAHPAAIPITLMVWLARIPIVHEVNGSYYDVSITHNWLAPAMSLVVALYRFQIRRADALIAVTTGLADWLRNEAPGVPVFTVPNGANCRIFFPTQASAKTSTNDYALFFGSLTRWHGIETMIAAVEHPAWPQDLDLLIVGDGQLGAFARQASRRNSRIRTLPPLPQEAVAEYINGATVGLVPINTVGGRGRFGLSPLKLYEMLACGLPVVVTDYPGQATLVRSLHAGEVIPPDDPEALARAVARLRNAPPPREEMLNVASIIKSKHRWGIRAAEIEQVLAFVMERSRR